MATAEEIRIADETLNRRLKAALAQPVPAPADRPDPDPDPDEGDDPDAWDWDGLLPASADSWADWHDAA